MLLGWECQGCKAQLKAKKNYVGDVIVPDKCPQCNESLFKRIEDLEIASYFDKQEEDYEDRNDYIKRLSDGYTALRGYESD